MTVNEALDRILVDLDTLQVSGYKNISTLVNCMALLSDVRDTLKNPPMKEAQSDDHEGDSDQGDEDEDA